MLTVSNIVCNLQVGIMTIGKLIAEESPTVLMERFQTNSLETVVLNLTRTANANSNSIPVTDNDIKSSRSKSFFKGISLSASSVASNIQSEALPEMTSIKEWTSTTTYTDSWKRMKALVHKNVSVELRSLT